MISAIRKTIEKQFPGLSPSDEQCLETALKQLAEDVTADED